jgi:hypothetical protein
VMVAHDEIALSTAIVAKSGHYLTPRLDVDHRTVGNRTLEAHAPQRRRTSRPQHHLVALWRRIGTVRVSQTVLMAQKVAPLHATAPSL